MDVLLAVAIVGFVAWWIRYNQLYSSGAVKVPFFSFGQTQQRPRRVKVAHRPATATRRSPPASQAQSRAIVQAVSKVSRYTHNYEVSVRLLQTTRQKHPDKTMDWCAEKVINDILRDRR